MASKSRSTADWKHLDHEQLTDPKLNALCKLDLIVGAVHYKALMFDACMRYMSKVIHGESPLGWLVVGGKSADSPQAL